MVVYFDSLNRFETPNMFLCNPGSTYSVVDNNVSITNIVGAIVGVSDIEVIFNFNAPSELNFRVTKYAMGDIEDLGEDEIAFLDEMYRKTVERRLIFVDGYGYFVVSECKETTEGDYKYKDVSATSCESELQRRGIPYIEDGTYLFTTLLALVMTKAGRWTLGNVDELVAGRYRTFEDVDIKDNVLDFLIGEMQEAYECFFDFNTLTRTINVYDKSNYVEATSILISNDDFVNKLDVTDLSDDLYTALNVVGENDISINAVNPLGTNTIYDFSHYYDWMDSDLKTAVQTWQEAVYQAEPLYYTANASYYDKLSDGYEAEMELQRLDTVRTMYQRARDNIVAQASLDQVNSYNDVISDNGGTEIPTYSEISDTIDAIDGLIATTEASIAQTQIQINQINTDKTTLLTEIQTIRDSVAMSQFFTEPQLIELEDYIFEGDYTDEYVVITDSMDYATQFAQIKTLYDRARTQLDRVSHPTQEFSVDVDNFIFHKDFESWTEQLRTGCIIDVEVEPDDTASLILMEFTVNYDDKMLSMKFGNRYTKFDSASLFQDALGDIKKTSNSVSFLKNVVYPIKNGVINQMQAEIENSRNLTKDAVLAATNESVIIDDTGYTGGRIDPDTGEMDPHQIKITGRNIAFTDDGWQTARTAIGEIILPGDGGDSTTVYGINAEALMGKVIIGSQVRIVDSSDNEVYARVDETISSVRTQYALGESETIAPTGDVWSDMAPAWEDGKFMWQRTITSFADGDTSISVPVCISGATGRPGEPATNITSIVPEYCLHDSASTPPTDGALWSSTSPAWEDGKYIWVRSRIYWEDGAETTTTPTVDNSLNSFGNAMQYMRSDIELDINGLSERFESTYGNLTQWIRVGIIDETEHIAGVKIGREDDDSNFSSVFTSDEIGFYEGNDKLAYLSNKKMNVKTIRTESIEFASSLGDLNGTSETSQWRMTSSADDGFAISWIG